ncbi:MAG TPA: stage III sporulation protein AG [Clostridiales bacterium]|jgi:stage III sporulation protein AG|nr:stage III sporulation protein AG [Clostridiales bacterium]
MEIRDFSKKTNGMLAKLKKNGLIAAALVLGAVLLLMPTENSGSGTSESSRGLSEPVFSLAEQERKIEEALSKISGAGKVKVVLTLKSGTERILASNEEISDSQSRVTYVTVQTGSGVQTVAVRYNYPIYQGALVVCQGAGNAAVRLQITEAVAALTGLTTDKITVTKMGD